MRGTTLLASKKTRKPLNVPYPARRFNGRQLRPSLLATAFSRQLRGDVRPGI
ncbi:hypothetical protein PTH_0524 [Pelotomaculum thermopropionicum SI]|uniref:Uncharacterized protein n=1 Tax=Pelotomaculum thermopropionicum (strain DSM 13744 / JCM 10971 / SI) TaxID=370438 RepID=A5D4Y9_PELTS|nr:hypothetical protein PTH_0524 [Pelotomaculum thermopropionicum SI]